ncbi:ABC transporter substrate-binding protein [Nocardioides piscis]|uniref:ABC transporter substrate-binding protein n=1 Tax=Nocardioides piscis TaxID=2714938 RepID=A0A6G7YDL4_9ACTN|nr:ABC transporter substrate-binding protein [Nocardioides piscis]QIK74728.1 ABC transporter substrate-binding protein [Nocardioides piscis]
MNAMKRHNTRRTTSALLATLALAVAGLTACGSDSESASPGGSSITIAEQSVAGMTTGLWPHLAEELGYLEDEDITVKEYISVTKGSDAISGMQSGAVQISHIGVEGISAVSKGADVVGLAAQMDASIWTVIANPDITSWDQLKGKTIALGSTSDITTVIFDRLAEAAGLDPAKDLTYVALGATPDRIAAVQNGQAAATIATYPPVETVIASGAVNDLGFAPEGSEVPRIMTTDIEASRSWAEDNPEVASGYLRAMIRTTEWVKDETNREEAVRIISELSENPPEAVLAGLETYFYDPVVEDAYFPENYRHDPAVFDDTVAAYMDLGILSEPVSEEDYMDYSYLEQAQED